MRLNAGHGYLLVTALAWGFNWPVMKLLMREWPPFSFRILAGGGAILLLLGIARWQGDRLMPPPGQWRRLAIAAVLNISAWSVVAPLSLFWLDASEAAIIAYTMPVWATMLAWPLLGERPTWPRVAGLVLGLGGVALLMAGPLASLPAAAVLAKLPGAGFMLLTALMFAAGAVFTKRYPVAMPQLPMIAWQLVIGLSPVVVIGLMFETVDWSRITVLGWGCLIYLGGVAQVVAYLSWFGALRRLPATTAAIGSLLVPVVGVFSSAWLLGEPLGPRQLASLALTLGGVVLAARG
jgi:drug/metabolite transporter (DMT)-like permease